MADDRTNPHPLYWVGRPDTDAAFYEIDIKSPNDGDMLCCIAYETKRAAVVQTWEHADALRREGRDLALCEVLRRLDAIALESTSTTEGCARVVDYMDEIRAQIHGGS